MPSPPVECVGCNDRKRGKSTIFYPISSITEPLTSINILRSGDNKRKVSLPLLEENELSSNKRLCKSCYDKLCYQPVEKLPEYDETPDNTIFRKAQFSHHQCIFKCPCPDDLIDVSAQNRYQLLVEYSLVTKEKSKWCRYHQQNSNSFWPFVKRITTPLQNEDFLSLSVLLSDLHQKSKCKSFDMFDANNPDSENINEETFYKWIGYSKADFRKILTYIRQTKPIQLAVFLCKIRHSLPNNLLSDIFNISTSSVANYIATARDDLYQNLVPVMINCHSRETLINHCTPIARSLFDVQPNQICLAWDATYRLIQKSSNYLAQRQFFSMHKKLPLHKVMVGVTTDGLIAYAFGPYRSNLGDAEILSDCLQRYPNQLNTLEEGDVFIMDRGFRDVVPELENLSFRPFTPTIANGRSLTTTEANQSRFVTKVRYIVEQVFGRLKKRFKFFAIPAHNGALKHDFALLSIAFSLMNLFHCRITSDNNDHDQILQLMVTRKDAPNMLQTLVEARRLIRQQISFVRLDSTEHRIETMFPQLTIQNLRLISLGSYQIRNSISYLAEHVQANDGVFQIAVFDSSQRRSLQPINYSEFGFNVQQPLLLKSKLHSRFRGAKEHVQFLLIDQSLNGIDAIVAHFCNCECGSRTVGVCSHIMTIIYYLSYGHSHPVHIPNSFLSHLSVTSV